MSTTAANRDDVSRDSAVRDIDAHHSKSRVCFVFVYFHDQHRALPPKVHMDTQLASEIVVLLGRELKLVKKKVEDLERELSEEVRHVLIIICRDFILRHYLSNKQSSRKAEKERADVAEYAMKASNLKAEKFGQENLKLRDELNLVRGVKQVRILESPQFSLATVIADEVCE